MKREMIIGRNGADLHSNIADMDNRNISARVRGLTRCKWIYLYARAKRIDRENEKLDIVKKE